MSARLLRVLAIVSFSLLPAALACDAAGTEAPAAADAATSDEDAQPVARIGDAEITVAELDDWIKDRMLERETEGNPERLHELRLDEVEDLISRRLLTLEAERRGIDADALLEEEAAKRVSVSEEEIAAFYAENQAQMGGQDLATMSDRIRTYLERSAGWEAARTFLAELRADADVEVLIQAPRHEVATTGASRGPEDAPVTIVEFSDYQCPYCQRAEPIIAEVLARYGDRVRFVYKHFPLDSIHPRARPASEAAGCAGDQDQFWAYHDKLFHPTQGLDDAAFEAYAAELKLDMDAFKTCLAERRHASQVSQDFADGQAAGVNSTPTFFINGIKLKGAQPVSEFQRVIDRELAKAS